jgi:hypothetical protein
MKLFRILPWFLLLTIIIVSVAMTVKEGMTTEENIVSESAADTMAAMVSPAILLVTAKRSINGTSFNRYKDYLIKQKFPHMNLKVYTSMNDDKTNEFLGIISTKNLSYEGNVILKPNPAYNITLPNSDTNKPFIDAKPEVNA